MSKTKLKTYVDKYKRLKHDPAKLQDQLNGETRLDDQERLEIAQAILAIPDEQLHPDADIQAAEKAEQASRLNPNRANPKLDLRRFDYTADEGFRGKDFADYIRMVEGVYDVETGKLSKPGELNVRDQFTFTVYDARPIIVKRYPGMKDSPTMLDGIMVTTPKPLMTTKIYLSQAIMLNQQILNAHAREHGLQTVKVGTGRYYFLKKD